MGTPTVFLPAPPVLLISDRRMAGRPLDEVVAAAIAGGCRWIMLREKDLSPAARMTLAQRLAVRAGAAGATLIVNDDLAAAAVGAGIHLPQGRLVATARRALGAEALIGVSAHSAAEAEAAALDGADYVTLSPVFPTASKPGYGPALTPAGLADVAATLPIPVLALGGVSPGTAGQCRRAGAAGIAVMGGVMRAADPAAAMQELIAAWTEGKSDASR